MPLVRLRTPKLETALTLFCSIPSVLVSNFKVSVLDDREMVGIENAEKLAWTASQVALVEVTSGLCESMLVSLDVFINVKSRRPHHLRRATERQLALPSRQQPGHFPAADREDAQLIFYLGRIPGESLFFTARSAQSNQVRSSDPDHRVNHRDGTGRGAPPHVPHSIPLVR